MTIPFLSYFKKKAPKEQPAAAPAPLPSVEKPTADRLSKTVMPNATRSFSTQEPFGGNSLSQGNGNAPAPAAVPRTIAFGITVLLSRSLVGFSTGATGAFGTGSSLAFFLKKLRKGTFIG